MPSHRNVAPEAPMQRGRRQRSVPEHRHMSNERDAAQTVDRRERQLDQLIVERYAHASRIFHDRK